ncbi:MAG: hypothetical protein IJ039_08645 [Clostridia bacterium]|nr:hypothetical protein [Clostridia bacterium]
MKYTHPAYINEEIETVDVICTSPYTVSYQTVKDENGNIVYDENNNPVMKSVVSVDVSKLF